MTKHKLSESETQDQPVGLHLYKVIDKSLLDKGYNYMIGYNYISYDHYFPNSMYGEFFIYDLANIHRCFQQYFPNGGMVWYTK